MERARIEQERIRTEQQREIEQQQRKVEEEKKRFLQLSDREKVLQSIFIKMLNCKKLFLILLYSQH